MPSPRQPEGHQEALHRGVLRVSLLEKGEARERWLTRYEAAKLLLALWRFREMQRRHRGADKGKVLPTKRYPFAAHRSLCADRALHGISCGHHSDGVTTQGRRARVGGFGTRHLLPQASGQESHEQAPASGKASPRLLAHMRRWERLRGRLICRTQWQAGPIGRQRIRAWR